MDASTTIRLTTLVVQLLSTAFMIVIFCVIKFNDLHHIDKRMSSLEDKHDELTASIGNIAVQVSSIDGFIKGQQSKKKQV